jgi:hypothetical protein
LKRQCALAVGRHPITPCCPSIATSSAV